MSGGLKNGKIQVLFKKGRADNPKVNAILLVEGGVENTHKASHDRYIAEIKKYYELMSKRGFEPE